MKNTQTGNRMADTRDMVVVHAALLRELQLAPGLVQSATADDRRRIAQVVDQQRANTPHLEPVARRPALIATLRTPWRCAQPRGTARRDHQGRRRLPNGVLRVEVDTSGNSPRRHPRHANEEIEPEAGPGAPMQHMIGPDRREGPAHVGVDIP